MNKTFPVTGEHETSDSVIQLKEDSDLNTSYENIHQTALRLVYANSPLEKSHNYLLKRVFDIFVSLFLIFFLLSWLIPILAILIKLDSAGPVFFFQKRNKKNGQVFNCIKFRSMIVNKDADRLASSANDKRVTSFGRFLRHYHLDELPQLFNVLYGDMSIVGPRPHMLSENVQYEKVIGEYSCRHQVKPGITGLAQSLGHFGSTPDIQKIKERVDLDLKYITHWSMAMDIQIMLRTFRMISGV